MKRRTIFSVASRITGLMSTRAISQSPSGCCLIQSMMMPWVNMALPAPTRTIFCFGGFDLSPVTGT